MDRTQRRETPTSICRFLLRAAPEIGAPADTTVMGGGSYREGGATACAGAQRPALSLRERQVLQQLADGATTAGAAAALFLSPTTVRSYAEAAMRKLESPTRTHAVAAALREGMIR
jgi:DNA-binding CsgD family transcriptional regulator